MVEPLGITMWNTTTRWRRALHNFSQNHNLARTQQKKSFQLSVPVILIRSLAGMMMQQVPLCPSYVLKGVDFESSSSSLPSAVQELAVAPLGGPLAVLTEDGRIVVFTGAGKWLREWVLAAVSNNNNYNANNNIKPCLGGLGWTAQLALVCVASNDGAVFVIDHYFAQPRRLKGFDAPIARALVYQGGTFVVELYMYT